MNPKVSIIVPIYNSEKYMSKCIESILNQTLSEIEIILVNDGSTDNSRKIIENYAKKDNRIKVIHQQNSGPSVARNKGIRIAKGKYIGFVDSDDYIEPNMYEELYNNANNKNIEVAMCSYNEKHLYNDIEYVIKPKLDSNRIYEKEDIKQGIISTFSKNDNYGFYSLCNKLYLKEWLIKENLTIDTNRDHGEDARLNLILLTKVNSIYFINKPLYNYYIRKRESLTTVVRDNMYKYILDNKNFHDYLCNLYGYQHLMDKGRKNYLNNIFQYMNSISISRFKLRKKVKILNQIMNDDTFKNNINSYECPYRYYKLLKLSCRYKLSLIYIFLIKLLSLKEKLDLIKENKISANLNM